MNEYTDGFKKIFDMIRQTTYERNNNITIISKEIISEVDCEDIKLIKVKKSTGEFGICIIYKTSKTYDNWIYWYPTKNQQEVLPHVAKILKDIDIHNKQFWGNNGN